MTPSTSKSSIDAQWLGQDMFTELLLTKLFIIKVMWWALFMKHILAVSIKVRGKNDVLNIYRF